MSNIKSVCIFCGSRSGNNPVLPQKAVELAEALSSKGIGLVYGAGDRGLMGSIAQVFKNNGARTIGIDCRKFVESTEENPYGLDEYIICETMLDRKGTMMEKADAFIALPGGMGTLDELTDAINLTLLGYMDKPIVVFNPEGYYDNLKAHIQKMYDTGFYKPCERLFFAENAEKVVDVFGLGDK